MSDPKAKSENYIFFEGINNKFSPFAMGAMEFLALENFDFQTPGALTQRWGSTMMFGQTFPGPIRSLFEFNKLNGESMIISSFSGGIFYGATTGQQTGMSLTNILLGFTFASGARFGDVIPFAGGATFNPTPVFYLGQANLSFPFPDWRVIISPQAQSDNTLSYSILQNMLFMADGNKFFKFNGASQYPVGLPPVEPRLQTAFANTIGVSQQIVMGSTGSYAFYASYVNSRGFEGQIWPIAAVSATNLGASIGGTYVEASVFIPTPVLYDIKSINLYSFWQAGPTLLTIGSTIIWIEPYVFRGNISITGATTLVGDGTTGLIVPLGSSLGGLFDLTNNIGVFPNAIVNTYFPLGYTIVPGDPNFIRMINYAPQYTEVYQNRLFLSGFSGSPSTVWFSDLAEPEGYQLTSNFDVRTNDGDVIRAMKSYQTRLAIFKRNSFHMLSGDTPNNFFLQQITDQYGCVNHRCAITHGDMMAFLDKNAIITFNGSQVTELSTMKVRQYFDRMNVRAAESAAIMVHDKLRNQIITSFPIDGATVNNLTLVYDYLATAFTTYKGFTASAYAYAQFNQTTKHAIFGDVLGRVNYFSSSFLTDNGQGFTLYAKPRFNHDMGDSMEKQYRRLYINHNPLAATLISKINFYQDYGASIVKSVTMPLNEFQERIDYGVAAKSLTFEISLQSLSQTFTMFGYTLEQRLQRKV